MARKNSTSKNTPAIQQMPLPTPRAAIYLRVSTEDQAVEGYGLDVQRERAKAQLTAKGWRFAGEYVDAGISGTKEASERPGLAALLEASQAGELDAVVVLALDRLGRNTRLVLALVETFTTFGVALVSCKESLDTSTPQGQFVLTMFAALAQLERDTIVERTTAGRNERGRIDGEKGGRVPFGYVRTADNTVVVDDTAAGVVRMIFGWRSAGATLTSIADRLNADNIPTARATQSRYTGAKWYARTVKSVLDNEDAYRGGRRGDSPVNWMLLL
ncbi:MAG TPA: recombinase family protein [Phototrophicaceae bacterium]|jgi:site-specific DNA recombinase|nr:recombinase family protein [Phototrophicaceae bacterium]